MLRLRNTTTGDLDFVLAAEQHPDNSPFVGQYSREQHQQMIMSPDTAHLIAERLIDRQVVGFLMMRGLISQHESIELRRLIITKKGQGYGRAALCLARTLAFEDCGAHRMWLDVKEHNHRARALYHSEGFVEEGTLRECIKYDGQFESLVIMSMLRPEYERLLQSAT
jgi:RimJ/RimL family protein N-acetyltransferase